MIFLEQAPVTHEQQESFNETQRIVSQLTLQDGSRIVVSGFGALQSSMVGLLGIFQQESLDHYTYLLEGDFGSKVISLQNDSSMRYTVRLEGVSNRGQLEYEYDFQNPVDLTIQIKGTHNKVTIQQYFINENRKNLVITLDEEQLGHYQEESLYDIVRTHIIEGAEYNDVLVGLDSTFIQDDIQGGKGLDWLSGGLGNDTLKGGEDNDTIIGGPGDDLIYGGTESDTFIYNLGDGNDTLLDAETFDTLELGPGISKNDLQFAMDESGFVVVKFKQTGETIQLNRSLSRMLPGKVVFEDQTDLTSQTILESLGQHWGTDDTDTLNFDEGITGVVIYAGAGDDTVTTGAGVDFIYGGDGDDTINGGGSDDTIQGDVGNDTLLGGDGDDTLYGMYGNDTLYGGTGDDRLIDFDGENTLYGNEGKDTLYSGPQNDFLDGGTGDDTYHVDYADYATLVHKTGQDTIEDFDEEQGNLDTIVMGCAAQEVSFKRVDDNLVITHIHTGDTIAICHYFFNKSYEIERIQFTDAIWGTEEIDEMLRKN